ncbi:MAG: outer membrane beta-barrel family protein [Muribaculaceae bacterium]|nr:outer membrane beta-barrel family protein [Muribaculaceae bacterium]
MLRYFYNNSRLERIIAASLLLLYPCLANALTSTRTDSIPENRYKMSGDTTANRKSIVTEISDSVKARELEEVVISGGNNYIKLNGNNITVDISHSSLGDMPTTEDMLAQLPFVKDQDGSFYVAGRGKAVIYIGNRKIQDSAELTRIRTTDIKCVEIIRNPGVEYDAEYMAVIKIILKRKIAEGMGIRAYTRESIGRRFSDYQQLSLSYGRGATDFFLTWDNDSYRVRPDQTNRETFFTRTDEWTMFSDMPAWNAAYYNWTISGGGNISLPAGRNAGAKITYTNDTERNVGNTFTDMTRNGEPYEILNSRSSLPHHYDQWQVNAYYDGNLTDKFNLNFNGDYLRRRSSSVGMVEEEGTFTPIHDVINRTTSSYDLWSGIMKFGWKPSEQSILSFGVDGNFIRHDHSSAQNYPEDLIQLNSREGKYAFFCQYAIPFRRYRLDVGVRYETMHLDYKNGIDDSTVLHKTYGRLFPAATLSAEFGKVNMSVGFDSRIKRPTFYQLRTESDYFNRYITVKGNPLLLPTYTYQFSYSMQYRELILNLGYQWVHNPIENESITDSFNPLHQIHYPVNIGKYEAFSIGVNYSKEVDFWRGTISGSLTKTFYDLRREFPSMPEIGHTPYMDFSMSNYFTFHGFTTYINVNYNPPGVYCNNQIHSSTEISAGIHRRFLKRTLYVSLRMANILGAKTKTTSYEKNYLFERTRYRDTRRLILTLSYTFRHKNKYKGKVSTTEEVNRM